MGLCVTLVTSCFLLREQKAHSNAWDAFLLWQSNFKPTFGAICDIMNSARTDVSTNKLLVNDNISFWKEVSTDGNILKSTINGVTDEILITDVWYYDHYYKLLNSNGDISNQLYVESIMNDIVNLQSVFSWFHALYIKHAIYKLKMGKSAGTDSMQGEH